MDECTIPENGFWDPIRIGSVPDVIVPDHVQWEGIGLNYECPAA